MALVRDIQVKYRVRDGFAIAEKTAELYFTLEAVQFRNKDGVAVFEMSKQDWKEVAEELERDERRNFY